MTQEIRQVRLKDIVNAFPNLLTHIQGDVDVKLDGVASPDSSSATKLLFLSNKKLLEKGLTATCAAVVVPLKEASRFQNLLVDKKITIMASDQIETLMARTIDAFFLPTPYRSRGLTGIHPTAIISPTAKIGHATVIGPHVVIGDHVTIGSDCFIGANSVIEDHAAIGDRSTLHSLVSIGPFTEIGSNCEIDSNSVIGKEGFRYVQDKQGKHYRVPHQGKVIIEDDVHIGGCCCIDRGTFGVTRICKGAKLDNQVHIAHNCVIGEYSLLTAGIVVAGSTKIGARFVSGGCTALVGHIEVCDNVSLAGMSGVTKSITKPGKYGGNPLLPYHDFVRMKVAMRELPGLLKTLRRLAGKTVTEKSTPNDRLPEVD